MCTRVCDSLKISYYCSPKTSYTTVLLLPSPPGRTSRTQRLQHKYCAPPPTPPSTPPGNRHRSAVAARKDDGGAINLPLDGGCLLEWNLVVYVSLVIQYSIEYSKVSTYVHTVEQRPLYLPHKKMNRFFYNRFRKKKQNSLICVRSSEKRGVTKTQYALKKSVNSRCLIGSIFLDVPRVIYNL